MKAFDTSIPDVKIIQPTVFGDSRGYFLESYRRDFFEKEIGETTFLQSNESYSEYGVLRGLHYQKPPFTQGKLVRVISGEVLDVVVDIRVNSPTFGEHVSVKLSGENQTQLWVPRGFAHGFVVLSETALFSYKCDNYYAPKYDAGLKWNDGELNIDWLIPESDIILSDKDKIQPSFESVKKAPVFVYGSNF